MNNNTSSPLHHLLHNNNNNNSLITNTSPLTIINDNKNDNDNNSNNANKAIFKFQAELEYKNDCIQFLENQVKELKLLLDKTRKNESKKYELLERKYLSAKGINVALERQLMFRNQQVELRKAKSSSSSFWLFSILPMCVQRGFWDRLHTNDVCHELMQASVL